MPVRPRFLAFFSIASAENSIIRNAINANTKETDSVMSMQATPTKKAKIDHFRFLSDLV
jgi:hypothetical protein